MKKILFFVTIALGLNIAMAHPVDVKTAQNLGTKFVEANFAASNRGLQLTLAHTAYTDRNADCFYVFNVGDAGFIIISADDFYRPVIGYSENGRFDVNNIPPALEDYLENIRLGRNERTNLLSAAPDVAADWLMLQKTGQLVSRHGGRGVDYLVQTQWDQSYPYNYFCPEDPNGSHGHTYVGCLATSMAQLVSFWKYPEHGNGSHCYYHEDYGQICADFENTYYDWDHIANKINENSPIEEIEAVALISFHCGVTIDMGYGPDGSGGASGPIPGAMHTYFSFADACIQFRRDDFETETWKSMVREQFDMGWPMYYGGCDDGCHAFICDGYDDHDMFHFNLGWGGSSDGWYIIDEAPYTNPADAMFNFVPQVVYDATPSAPTAISVTKESELTLDATISWTNPTTYLDGTALTNIEKMVVMRNNMVVAEISANVTPGQQMSWTDHVPYYDNFGYQVYAVSGGRNGKQVMSDKISFGPTCDWKFVLSANGVNGWNGNYISVYSTAGTEIAQVTLNSSTPAVVHVDMPVGRCSLAWNAVDDTNVTFTIKDSNNNSVYSYSGPADQLGNGVFFGANNGCGNDAPVEMPSELTAFNDGDDVVIQWTGINEEGYGYNIYRDGRIFALTTETQYVDAAPAIGGHCYQVCYLGIGGESELSNEACANVGEGCDPGTDLWYELQDNFKPIIKWTAPEDISTLTGYYVYRKTDDTDYELVKLVGPSKTEYKENKPMVNDTWYSYRVIAFYQGVDCYSAPFKAMYGNNYYVRMYYSTDGINENLENAIDIYPNPVKDAMIVKAENISGVTVYNALGQKVCEKSVDASEVTINFQSLDSGIYLVKVVADGNEVTRKVSVQK
ncbi:MAG: C10 family peptidase [Bacteroidales bacterium]|nr:C10 family peptidase [Bacteroidales bacterium]